MLEVASKGGHPSRLRADAQNGIAALLVGMSSDFWQHQRLLDSSTDGDSRGWEM